MNRQPITIICGPTAGGKSALAMETAQNKDGVIINADSLQLYDALPLLTAQPSDDDKAKVPHQLYAFLQPHQKYSAQQWRDAVHTKIETVLNEGRHPVIVGGTGLYLKALIEGLSPISEVPPEIRAETMALQSKLGHPAFHAALAERDPIMAARLNPNDTQRLVRAYEVIMATGKSLAEWQALPLQGPPAGWRFTIIVKSPERSALHKRIDSRFDMMMQAGALDEVRAQIDLPDESPVTHALGYRQLREHIRGLIPLEDALQRSKAETRQYAKRQDTWFRNQIQPNPALDEIIRVF